MIRERSFTWTDPQQTADDQPGHGRPRPDQGIFDGVIPPPPITALVGLSVTEVEAGRVVMGLTPAEYHYNPIGIDAWRNSGHATGLGHGLCCAFHAAERSRLHIAGDQGEFRAGGDD